MVVILAVGAVIQCIIAVDHSIVMGLLAVGVSTYGLPSAVDVAEEGIIIGHDVRRDDMEVPLNSLDTVSSGSGLGAIDGSNLIAHGGVVLFQIGLCTACIVCTEVIADIRAFDLTVGDTGLKSRTQAAFLVQRSLNGLVKVNDHILGTIVVGMHGSADILEGSYADGVGLVAGVGELYKCIQNLVKGIVEACTGCRTGGGEGISSCVCKECVKIL